jgi:nucleoside-diphosphate-sugar epimerase
MFHETILVTGAAGGVGSTAHTAIATLREQGHRVRAMVRKLDANHTLAVELLGTNR